MYQSNEDDDDFLAALWFDQSNGGEDPYAFIQTEQGNLFPEFGSSSGVNLQTEQEQEQVCNNNNIGAQFDSFSGNNGLGPFGGVLYSSSIVEKEQELVCCGVVEINSSSSVGGVKEELEEECSRKRGRTGPCSKPGTKACREKKRREMLNDKFMDLSSFLEPTRTPKTDKPAILDDAIRVVNQLRGEAHELKETNQKLLEEIKTLKAEKNELREEKLVLKADKEKMEQQLKSMAAVPSPGFMPSHPAAFHQNKMAVYASYGYYPNMPMMPYLLPPSQRDTSQDQQNCSFAA
ncbi:transcription factor bHLH34 [Brassica rapa]|uniref:BHLH domain-containing protein n=1 Tax=Brassica campestris TaxID=3711 RepID=A0A679KMC4_BRACM|nr:transcription factor bHLH34 [Brassica rapa]CAA8286848.1 Unknown [Brassica rapa]CAA8287815.1 Unknown [Brassica rapa]CAA8392432.1 Unknown [Brassica rapa]CAA8404107.1 Unknown [Brassica rapa]